MLCKCHWIVLYTVHFTAFCLGAVLSRTRCIFILRRSINVYSVYSVSLIFLSACSEQISNKTIEPMLQ